MAFPISAFQIVRDFDDWFPALKRLPSFPRNEDNAFWIISGPWAKLHQRIQKDPRVAFCVDIGDFDSGIVKQVIAHGSVQMHDYDVERARRLLYRYLGPDEDAWSDSPDDYRSYLRDGGPPGAVFLRLEPVKMTALNFSYARTRVEM